MRKYSKRIRLKIDSAIYHCETRTKFFLIQKEPAIIDSRNKLSHTNKSKKNLDYSNLSLYNSHNLPFRLHTNHIRIYDDDPVRQM